MHVEGTGTVQILTKSGNINLLHNVQFVPDLGYNPLSVEQWVANGYSVSFDASAFIIQHKEIEKRIHINMASNNMFSLDVAQVKIFALATTTRDRSELWNLRYGHLNFQGLKLLGPKGMVTGLPKITFIDLCEECIHEKQVRKSFPIGKALRVI